MAKLETVPRPPPLNAARNRRFPSPLTAIPEAFEIGAPAGLVVASGISSPCRPMR
jgi:hypothetical protein